MKLSLILIISLFLLACSGCGEDKKTTTNNDTDKISDTDIINDTDSLADTDLSPDKETLPDPDISGDNDSVTDTETLTDKDSTEVDCPALKDANFPYTRADGSIHFCRKCDTPESDDPDCARNLWKEANKEYFAKYPEQDCLHYPCVVEKMAPYQNDKMSKCELYLTKSGSQDFNTSPAQYRGAILNKGKIGIFMYVNGRFLKYGNDGRIFEYDIESKKYKVLIPDSSGAGYYGGNALGHVVNSNTITSDPNSYNASLGFLIYYDKNKGYKSVYPGRVSAIYNNITMSDKWVYLVMQEKESSKYEMKYAKIGEWKWKTLDIGIPTEVSIKNDKLAVPYNGKVYVCDLSTSPDSIEKCRNITKEGDSAWKIKLDDENEERAVYETGGKLVIADMSGETIKYDVKTVVLTEQKVMGVEIDRFRGDIILYGEVFERPDDPGYNDGKICYYLISENKSYCGQKNPSLIGLFGQSWSDFEGKYLTYHNISSSGQWLRDMECYCKEQPDSCPFADWRPAQPKKVKKSNPKK